MKQQNILIIFAKNPVKGNVKTRLAATVGAEKAFEVYKELLAYTKATAQNTAADKIVYYSDKVELHDIWDERFLKAVQQGADLGERMTHAFQCMFQQGYTKAVIIGTDCPSLDGRIIADAYKQLDTNDIVIGPAFDGGYYLLGMKKLYTKLFEGKKWGTQFVFEKTIATCTHLNLRYIVLPVLHDIDEEKDLAHIITAQP